MIEIFKKSCRIALVKIGMAFNKLFWIIMKIVAYINYLFNIAFSRPFIQSGCAKETWNKLMICRIQIISCILGKSMFDEDRDKKESQKQNIS